MMDPERWPSLEWPPLPADLRAHFATVDQVLKVGHPELINGAQTWAELEQDWADFQARPRAMTATWSSRILLVLDHLQARRWRPVTDLQSRTGLRTLHVQGALAWLLGRHVVESRGNPREYRIR